jgi:hypothetical protein
MYKEDSREKLFSDWKGKQGKNCTKKGIDKKMEFRAK